MPLRQATLWGDRRSGGLAVALPPVELRFKSSRWHRGRFTLNELWTRAAQGVADRRATASIFTNAAGYTSAPLDRGACRTHGAEKARIPVVELREVDFPSRPDGRLDDVPRCQVRLRQDGLQILQGLGRLLPNLRERNLSVRIERQLPGNKHQGRSLGPG
jgi:hypothetical protein